MEWWGIGRRMQGEHWRFNGAPDFGADAPCTPGFPRVLHGTSDESNSKNIVERIGLNGECRAKTRLRFVEGGRGDCQERNECACR